MDAIKFVEDWFEEVWNKNNTNHIDSHLAENCNVTGLADKTICCPDDFHKFHRLINQGFANLRCTVVRAIENGDEVAGYVKVNAIHSKTGKPVEFHTSFIATLKDGKLQEILNTVNFLDAFVQIGAVRTDIMESI